MFVPSYYARTGVDPRCGQLVPPNLQQASMEGKSYAKSNGIRASSRPGQSNVVLSVIDQQIDFINPSIGNLCVPGAVEDTDRLNRFIYNNIAKISHIVASLDTHYLFQPFHPFNWEAGPNPVSHSGGPLKGMPYSQGDNPDPFTLITLADLDSGAWRATRNPGRMREMIEKLENQRKKTLCIWPLHCILGTPGHAFEPTFMEAVFFHAAARNEQYDAATKGMSQSSEHYGILRAEVEFIDDLNTQINQRILSKWEQADRVYFAGQAKSHCVLETLEQVVSIFGSKSNKNDLLDRLYVIEDCMSSVPDIKDERGNVIVPFDNLANQRFAEFRKMGVKFVKSTDPISI